MQWEFPQQAETQNNTSAGASAGSASGDGQQTANDSAMDISYCEESLRDISMAAADEAPAETLASAATSDGIEEIPRATSVPQAGAPSTQLVRPHSVVRRRRSSSASSSASARQRRSASASTTHWPLAPVVGTVINYLVPPVSEAPDSNSSGRDGHSDGKPDARLQRAKETLHPREKPLLLLSYAQLAFNASLLFIALYIVFALVWTIRLDVVERLREVEDAYHHSVTSCQRSFDLNCLSVPLPPALHTACAEWERCSARKFKDVLGGSRLRVVIEVISEAWEAGVAGLGWRTLAFSLLLLSIFVGGFNTTLNSLRLGVARKSKDKRKGSRRQRLADEDEDGDDSRDFDESYHRQRLHKGVIAPHTPSALSPLSPGVYHHDAQRQQEYLAALMAANQAPAPHLLSSMYNSSAQTQQHIAHLTSPSARRSKTGNSKGGRRPPGGSPLKSSSLRGRNVFGSSPEANAAEWIDDDGDSDGQARP
ncbi:unnamed protein product [Parajaminaea phylloscopi]